MIKNLAPIIRLIPVFLVCSGIGVPAQADTRSLVATGEYRMGDNDTRSDAKRLALLDAKRRALEQAGTYVESETHVKNLEVTKDEIRAFTAGLIEVDEQTTQVTLEGQTTIVRVTVNVRIDTDLVTRQIAAIQKNVTAKAEFEQLRVEVEHLRQELQSKTAELKGLRDSRGVALLKQARQRIIDQLDASELISRAGGIFRELDEGALTLAPTYSSSLQHPREMVERALAENSDIKGGHYLRARLLEHQGHFQAAIQEYQTYLSLMPDREGMILEKVGELEFIQGNIDAAFKTFQKSSNAGPFSFDGHWGLASVYLFLGELDRAAEETTLAFRDVPAVREMPQDKAGRTVTREYYLPRSHFEPPTSAQEVDELLEMNRYVLRYNPYDMGQRYDYAKFLVAKGDLQGGISQYRVILRFLPRHVLAHLGLGFSLWLAGDKQSAVQELQIATHLKPDLPETHIHLGDLLAELGDTESAIKEFESVLALRPGDEFALWGLGRAFARNGKWKDAVAVSRALVHKHPEDWKAHVGLGIALHGAHDWYGAISELREALRIKPNAAPAHYNLGRAFNATENYKAATEEFRTTLQLEPDFFNAHYGLGLAYIGQKHWIDARKELQEYLRIVPREPKYLSNIEEANELLRSTEKLAQFNERQRFYPGCTSTAHAGISPEESDDVAIDFFMLVLLALPLSFARRTALRDSGRA